MNIQDVKQIVLGGGNNPSQIRQAWVSNKQIWPIDNTEEEVMSHLVNWFDNTRTYQNDNYKLSYIHYGVAHGYSRDSYLAFFSDNPFGIYTCDSGIGCSGLDGLNFSSQGETFLVFTSSTDVQWNVDYHKATADITMNSSIDPILQFIAPNTYEITLVVDQRAEEDSSLPFLNGSSEAYEILDKKIYSQGFIWYRVQINKYTELFHCYNGQVQYTITSAASEGSEDYVHSFSTTSYISYANTIPKDCTIITNIVDTTDATNSSINTYFGNIYVSNISYSGIENPIILRSNTPNIYMVRQHGNNSIVEDTNQTIDNYEDNGGSVGEKMELINYSAVNGSVIGFNYLIIFDKILTDEQILWVYNNMIKK